VTEEQKPKKIIKRRRPSDPNDPEKEKARKLRQYFSQRTQDAIIKYQTLLQDPTKVAEKNAVYTTEIAPAFEKLVENLINIHKFTSLYDSYEDLKSDCTNFLFETIPKWQPDRGTMAFSYFNVVAKNCLINRVKQKNQRLRRNVSIDNETLMSQNELRIIEEHNTIPSQDAVVESRSATREMIAVFYSIRECVHTENELVCINSIITLFENIDGLDIFAKSAVLLYIRELSGLSPKQLTTAMQGIKKHYKKFKADADLDGIF
jgi:DNA-directed RNA polymerase specialized sigma24 family protein